MKLRLIPVLLIAVGALLTLKLLGLVMTGHYAILPVPTAFAQQEAPEAEAQGQAEREGAPKPLPDGAALDGPSSLAPGAGNEGLPAGLELGGSSTERKVLESLSERRRDLDKRDKQNILRDELLKATERRIEEKVKRLEALEQRLTALQSAEETKAAQEIKDLVIMYESMKPKDAARIFDRLDSEVLLKVASEMKPRKMAGILAAMSPDVAQKLTVALAKGQTGAQPAPLAPGGAGQPASTADLPKIQGN